MGDQLLQLRASKGWLALRLQFVKFPERVKQEIAQSNAGYAARMWGPALEEQGPSIGQQIALVDGASAKPHTLGVTLVAAASGATLSGGLNTGSGRNWAGFEFGATPKVISVVRAGTRRDQLINRQFAPRRSKGKIVYPAAARVGTRAIGRWVSAVVKAIAAGHPDVKTK